MKIHGKHVRSNNNNNNNNRQYLYRLTYFS